MSDAAASSAVRGALAGFGGRATDLGGPGGRASFAESTEGRLWDWAQARRGLRLRTLVWVRWASFAGQLFVLLAARYVFDIRPPLLPCLLAIGAAGLLNLSMSVAWPGARVAGKREAVAQLAFDIAQLTALLWLTGGLQNPFSLLLIAPATVAAATLPTRSALAVGALSLVAAVGLAVWRLPLPWTGGQVLELPELYRFAILIATTSGIVFTGFYAWQAQAEAQAMELALAATQAVLAREQRLSALGGLAAAAAHELGTPLATIQVVTKEMLRELEAGSVREDVQLLSEQAERCRDILRRLSTHPEASDQRHARMSLSQLMEEIADPYRDDAGEVSIECEVTCAVGASILEVRRLPEVLHGLSAFVENAVDFAESIVEVTAHYDADRLLVEVRDDGPGFPPDVMARLGDPYVTTRPAAENSRSNHLGMGLGFFIAKTLLERTGAAVEFRNARRGGAVVCARWPRARVEAEPDPLDI